MMFATWQALSETFGQWLARSLTRKVRLDPDLSAWLGKDSENDVRFYIGAPKPHEIVAGKDAVGNVREFYRGLVCEITESRAPQWTAGELNVTKHAALRFIFFDRSNESDETLRDGERYWNALFEPPGVATLDNDEHPDWRTSLCRLAGTLSAWERHSGEISAEMTGLVAAVSKNS